MDNNKKNNSSDNYLWKDRKRSIFGLPLSFTRYALTNEKLIIDVGFLSRTEDEVRLYRIMDLTLKRSLGERIFGLGTIHCCSADKSLGDFDIKRIKKAKEVRDMLSEMIENKRKENRVGTREFMEGDFDNELFHDYE